VAKISNHIDIRSYPGPITLYRSWAGHAGLFLVLVVFGIEGIRRAMADHDPLGWFGGPFLLLVAAYCGVMLLPGAGSLTLGPVDFEVVRLFRRSRYKWRDVSAFAIWKPYWPGGVVFNDRTRAGMAAAINAGYMGYNSYLPGFGLWPQALANLMNRWREQALAAQPQETGLGQSVTAHTRN
jgi:hypothetical protein